MVFQGEENTLNVSHILCLPEATQQIPTHTVDLRASCATAEGWGAQLFLLNVIPVIKITKLRLL